MGGGGVGITHLKGGGGDVPKRYLTKSYCMLWLSSLLLSQVDFLATSVTGGFPRYFCHRWISSLLLSQVDFLVNSVTGGFPS